MQHQLTRARAALFINKLDSTLNLYPIADTLTDTVPRLDLLKRVRRLTSDGDGGV